MELTVEEKRQIDEAVVEIILDIKDSRVSESAKLISAFIAGVKFCKEKIIKLNA